MSSQGLISVTSEKQVLMKIIVSCNGCNAQIVADELKKIWPVDIDIAYSLARRFKFGCQNSLIVLDLNNIKYLGSDIIIDTYRKTFYNPRFNPSCEEDTADYAIIIEV